MNSFQWLRASAFASAGDGTQGLLPACSVPLPLRSSRLKLSFLGTRPPLDKVFTVCNEEGAESKEATPLPPTLSSHPPREWEACTTGKTLLWREETSNLGFFHRELSKCILLHWRPWKLVFMKRQAVARCRWFWSQAGTSGSHLFPCLFWEMRAFRFPFH